jgi:hypothetical protein
MSVSSSSGLKKPVYKGDWAERDLLIVIDEDAISGSQDAGIK